VIEAIHLQVKLKLCSSFIVKEAIALDPLEGDNGCISRKLLFNTLILMEANLLKNRLLEQLFIETLSSK